ncbi:helix-turn-helix transcriptional regulator [Streptomyces cylindrosporus]|uniref:WYL domain-containing protein n=1 Tax=Streptomyces cylindrosporus TaxID=2927583 RepID=A0ABS9YLG0_9ACTN|nr:WYL domain-containing protein [Streptomyces cylindrosporus]MCI3278106.1 WYL domain-containing protein [Streptomyces cylindrosporus]
MRADRLLSLLLCLQSRGQLTARQLADELEVSVRTVYRDLEALGAAGVPVVASGGPGGGCRLLEGWRSPLLGISAEEATALLAVSAGGPLERIALGDALSQARLKLLAALPPAGRDRTRAAAARFHIDTEAWFKPPEPVPCLAELVDAVRRDRRLRVTHRRRDGRTTTRTVDPLGLVAKAGVWYLVARSGPDTRAHRASRITQAESLPTAFTRPPDFDLTAFWTTWTTEFEASLDQLPVTVSLSPAGLAALPAVLGDPTASARATPDPDGRHRLTLHFDSPTAACRRLLAFGPDVEVLEPADVRAELAETARRTAALYG